MKKKYIWTLAMLALFSWGAGEVSFAAAAEKSQVVIHKSKKTLIRPSNKTTAAATTETAKTSTAKRTVGKKTTTSQTAAANGAKKSVVRKSTANTTAQKTTKTTTASAKSSKVPAIEVGLLTGSEVTFTGLADFRAESDGKVIGTYKSGQALSVKKSGNKLVVNGKTAGSTITFTTGKSDPAFSAKGNRYRGTMKAVLWSSGVTLVNHVSMEDYLRGVVPCEIVPSWQMEAIKAQAVAARTYALFHKNGYRSSGYDVTDDTLSQVYRGASAETDSTDRAVAATAGQVVTYGGKVIDAVFHSSGGGYTEDCANVWGTSVPYLKGVAEEKYAEEWTKTATLDSLAKLANVGKLKSIKLSKLRIGQAHKSADRGVSGRVKTVVIVGSKGTKTLTGDNLQSAYGLNSTLFDLSVKGKNLIITGYGYGHGLGLSQWGAQAMAEKHKNEKDYYKTILTHYFTGTKIEKIY